MKPEDGANRLHDTDSYATRPMTPGSLEALEAARISAAEDFSKAKGVGRDELERGLIDGGFLDAEGLRVILADLESEALAVDSETLARHLVRIGKLTRYQASALFQGKGRALQIGPYIVLDKLGSGGMGMVFKAGLRKGGPEIALKLLPPSASRHPNAVLRFRREAEIMEQLNHANLVPSHEIGQYGGVHYLVMDYVEGHDLDRVVRSTGPLKLNRAVDCIIQAARGLGAAHDRGIVHRDIKPANLLLDTKGTVRVLDLGLARITQGDESVKDSISAPSLTASGIIMGTVDFLPPEQSDDSKRADHRADIYALGCTFYFLLTGKPPYAGESIMQRLLAHHHKPIPSLSDARPDVPLEIDLLYRKMMSKAPENRPQSIAEVVEALEAWRTRSSGGRSLRVFNDGGVAKPAVLGSAKPEETDRKPPEDGESYDLMTFVREALLTPDPTEKPNDLAPVLPRKSKKAQKSKGWADWTVRGLVAAASLAVLIRFFPKELFTSKPTAPPVTLPPDPPPNPLAPGDDLPVVKIVPPVVIQQAPKPSVPILKSETPLKSEPDRRPGGNPPADPGPPPAPSLLEELMRPPPPGSGPPGSPPPRDGSAARKKGQGPPRAPGSP
jgi:serine/threonine protein kinase